MSEPRRWVAGLVECLALVVDHLGQGLTLLAETIDPDAALEPDPDALTRYIDGDHTHLVPTSDPAEHDLTDSCRCVPRVTGFAATGSGDRWTYTHNPMPQEDA